MLINVVPWPHSLFHRSRTAELQDKADDVKSQMQRNLNYAMERGERLEDMEKAAGFEGETLHK